MERSKPFCGLEDAFFQEDLKILIATRSDRFWRGKEGQRQDKDLLGDWNLKNLRACLGPRLKRLIGFLPGIAF